MQHSMIAGSRYFFWYIYIHFDKIQACFNFPLYLFLTYSTYRIFRNYFYWLTMEDIGKTLQQVLQQAVSLSNRVLEFGGLDEHFHAVADTLYSYPVTTTLLAVHFSTLIFKIRTSEGKKWIFTVPRFNSRSYMYAPVRYINVFLVLLAAVNVYWRCVPVSLVC